MNPPTWKKLTLLTDKVPAKPAAGLWTRVCDFVAGPVKLKIQASGDWNYSGATKCGPDGSRAAGFATGTLNESGLLGALIGKVGGSAGEKPGAQATTFVAGTYVIVVLADGTEGPLYLTMNDQPSHFEEHDGELVVTIEDARS